MGSDGLVSGLEGSPQKTCERARSSRPHSRRRGRRVARVGPTRGARGAGWLAGAAPSLPDSRRAHARRGPVSGDPRERGRGEPRAPRMKPHASAGPGRVSPGTTPRSSAGREREGPAAAPSPARDGRPGFLPGSASRLQRVGMPPATPRLARLLTQTPPLSSLLARGTRPAPASDAGPSRRRLHPPPGFKLKFPGWGRQRTHRASPAPSWRKPRPAAPAQHAPGAETPAGRPRPHGQSHAPGAGWRGRGAFARGSRGSPTQCPAAGARFVLAATLELMTASAHVRGVLSENPGLKCPLNF